MSTSLSAFSRGLPQGTPRITLVQTALLLFLLAPSSSCFRRELSHPVGESEVVRQFSEPSEIIEVEPLLLFSGNTPYVFYYYGKKGELRLATPGTTPAGVSWVETRILGSESDPRGKGVRGVEKSGVFHLVYTDPSTGNVHYTLGKPGAWQHVDPLPPGDRRETPDLALDPRGLPWIVYRNATQGGIELLHPEGSVWVREVVERKASSGYGVRIGMDPGGRKYLLFSDTEEGALKALIGKSQGEWVTEVVDPDLKQGASWISLSMGPRNFTDLTEIYPRVLYYDRGNRILKYAEKLDLNKPWRVEVVDPNPFRGSDNSILVDSRGTVWVSYLDGTQLDLWLGRKETKSWNLWREEGSGSSGFRTSLAEDRQGNLALLYLRYDTRAIMYHRIRGVE